MQDGVGLAEDGLSYDGIVKPLQALDTCLIQLNTHVRQTNQQANHLSTRAKYYNVKITLKSTCLRKLGYMRIGDICFLSFLHSLTKTIWTPQLELTRIVTIEKQDNT